MLYFWSLLWVESWAGAVVINRDFHPFNQCVWPEAINIHVSFIFKQLMLILDSHFRWRVKNNANLQYLFVWELRAPVMAKWFNSIGSFVELYYAQHFCSVRRVKSMKHERSLYLSLCPFLGQNGFHYVRNHGNQLGRVTSVRFTWTLHYQEYTGKENFDPNLK